MRSIEERIHSAIRNGKGMRFNAEDLEEFICCDDALLCRIANTAAAEGGRDEPGEASESIFNKTWEDLKRDGI